MEPIEPRGPRRDAAAQRGGTRRPYEPPRLERHPDWTAGTALTLSLAVVPLEREP